MLKKILVISPLIILSCQSTEKKDFAVPEGFIYPELFLNITKVTSPALSADGKRLLYVKETKEQNNQIFLYDFATETNRQITHQVGKITEVGFFPDEKNIIYTSSTDEDKENPRFLRIHLNPDSEEVEDTYNTEIYRSNLFGGDIIRITRHEGFDGYFDIHPTSEEIIYSEKGISFFRIKKGKKSKFTVFQSSKKNEKLAKFSPNGNHLVWLSESNGDYSLNIIGQYGKSKKVREVSLPKFSYVQSLNFHPQSEWLLMSALEKGALKSDIFALNIITECLLRLTYYPGPDLDPAFHPNGKIWYTVSNRDGENRIYQSSYWPSKQCNKEDR